MPDEPKDEKVTPAEQAAEVIDSPASTAVHVVQDATPPAEEVIEVIEEHTPPVTPIDNGLQAFQDAINKRFDDLEKMVKPAQPEPIQPEPEPKKEEVTDGQKVKSTTTSGSGTSAERKRGGLRFIKRG